MGCNSPRAWSGWRLPERGARRYGRFPARFLRRPSADGAFFGGRVDAGGAFLLAFAAVTAYLEMASRQFTDDFSAFHDHEHWPGYCLVLLRLCLAHAVPGGGNATIAAAESRHPDAAVFSKKAARRRGGAWLARVPVSGVHGVVRAE